MQVKKLADLDVAGKKVFIRADLNVPQDDAGNITEDTRIRASIPSIRYCLDRGAAVMVTSHLGRPTEGVVGADDTLAPDTKLTVETDGFAPYVVGTLPIGDWFEVFAKAGYYWYDVEARLSTPLGSADDSTSDEAFTWSAGVGLNVFERINVRLEYEQFDIENTDDSNALWLTGAWRF